MRDDAPRFPTSLRLRVPLGLVEGIDAIARRQATTPAQVMRTALLRHLEAEGLHLVDGRVERLDAGGSA